MILISILFSGCSNYPEECDKDCSEYNTDIVVSETVQYVSEISGYYITIDELMPIVEKACICDYFITGGDDMFYYKDGVYIDSNGRECQEIMNYFDDVFSEESNIAQIYFSMHKGYVTESQLYIMNNIDNQKAEEDIRNIKCQYNSIYINGGKGSNSTFIKNELQIINRSENRLTLKNTAYYTEENKQPIQTYEYDMVFENGQCKFSNFES